MTQELLTALAPDGQARSAQSEALSFRTSPQTGVAIRTPETGETGEERIATPVTRSLVRNDREETGDADCHGSDIGHCLAMTGEARSAQSEALSFRTSPQTGVGIRTPGTGDAGEERIAPKGTRRTEDSG